MKILILKGSPREKDNSSVLADQLAAGAQKAGAEVESILSCCSRHICWVKVL